MSKDELLALTVTPASLSAEELEEFAEKYLIVSLQQQGLSAAEALARAECEKTTAWARKWRRRWEEFGAAGLLDLRKFNHKEEEVMTSDVKTIVLKHWHGLPAAGVPLITTRVAAECEAKGLPAPSMSSVQAYLDSLPEPVRLTRAGHFDVWDKQARPTRHFHPTTHANQRFQTDHKKLDIWSRVLVADEWQPRRLWITVLLDDFSRALAGLATTVGVANSWSITQTLRHAILPKENPDWKVHGLPELIQCDNGADFLSASTKTALATLNILQDLDPPYYPNGKGKVERFFQTMDQACLRGLPGHIAAIGTSEGAAAKHVHELLTPDQVWREMERWVVEDYHQRTHSVTGRKPLELWQETVHLRVPDEADVFRVLLRMDGRVRVVQPKLRFSRDGRGGEYWSPDLFPLYGKRVRIAYTPEDMRRIAVFSEETGEFVAEPWLLGHPDCPYSEDMIERESRAYRRGLSERIKAYREEWKATRAEPEERQEWDEARKAAENDPEPEPEPADPDEEEVRRMLDEMDHRYDDHDGDAS